MNKAERKRAEEKYRLLKELERRECINDFYKFCVYMDSTFFTIGKPHLKTIADALQEVADGKLMKLAISMPPRAGKSYIASLFCLWMIGKNPAECIMRNSHTASLAEDFSFSIRDWIQGEKFKAIFSDVVLRKDRQSVEKWATTKSKQLTYFCAGVNGSITGKGANLIAILDDPIKDIQDAMSETVIESTWRWYKGVHQARIEDGCPEIHIATRWSRNDPIGRLTDPNSESYDPTYKTIVIPALINGQTFCREIHTTEYYIDYKRGMDDFIWEAEFMQNPIESKGLLFPIEELNRFTMDEIAKKPDGIVGFTDTADKGSDSLSSPIGRIYSGYTYITDVVFTQDGVEITEPLVAQQIIDTKCDIMKIESNNGGSSFARNVRKLIKGKSPCSVIEETTTQNKETRILMSAGYIKEHFYFRSDYLPGSDYDKFMRALTSYVKLGKNKHDDAPDSITGLAEYVKYRAFGNKEKPKRDPFLYRDEIDEDTIDDSYIDMRVKGYR